jgi:hypothetical protein
MADLSFQTNIYFSWIFLMNYVQNKLISAKNVYEN